ncbi:Alpha-type protein kinase domain-containing protein [Fusarium sp. LHS14.1]|nr:Alpha-type protein kinase domain-containing protein [Fusarium sp. LHS14.1]
MDPISSLEALSLAANILQFIYFAKDCYTAIKEIRASPKGLTNKNDELLSKTSRMDDVLRPISDGLGFLEGDLTLTEHQIRHVALKCQAIAKELREDIKSRSVKDRSNVKKLVLNAVKGRHRMAEVGKKVAEWEDLKKELFQYMTADMSQQQSGLKAALEDLTDQSLQLGMAHSSALDQMESKIQAVISKDSESRKSAAEAIAKLFEWKKRVYELKKAQVILQSLRFDEMEDRKDGIVEAQLCTFQWVEKPKLNFLEWLSKDDGLFWVTGHPGSGKSTLMKYLNHHTTTHEKLKQWAAPKTLVKVSFYFWFSGTALQRSQEGLLRSLLFEILRECHHLIPKICRSRWNSDFAVRWTRAELKETLKSLTLKSTSAKFFFLIDGLDEYQDSAGPRGGKESGIAAHVSDIIEVINGLANNKSIKLCISSRPWLAFEEAFGRAHDRKLYVHDENRDDIDRYIRERFFSSPAIQKSSITRKELRNLCDLMVKDSGGVFLWVSLVVETLLHGLGNDDSVDLLHERLAKTPKTLNAMFERMLDSVEDTYHEQAARILLVASRARAPMYVAVYSFICDGHLSFSDDLKPWTKEKCLEISEKTQKHLKVRCPDLIKIRGSPGTMTTAQKMTKHQVEFLHRTVKEFLSLEDTQKMLKDRAKKEFDPIEFISKALLAQIRGAQVFGRQTWSPTAGKMFQLLDEITYYVSELEQKQGGQQTQMELLDKLHETIAKQTGSNNFTVGYDSFVGIMAQKDIHFYVEQHLPGALHAPGASLLGSILFPRWERPRKQTDGLPNPSITMIDLLLHHGAKVDELSEDKETPLWNQYMTRVYKARSELKDNTALRRTHIGIIRRFLEHNADPKIECVVGYTDPKPTVGRAKGIRYPVCHDVEWILKNVFEPEDRKQLEMRPGMRKCAECGRTLPRSSYTAKQYSKGISVSRCASCVHGHSSDTPSAQQSNSGRYNISNSCSIPYAALRNPFSQGAFRWVAKGVYASGTRKSQACVVKWFKSGAVFEADYFTLDIKAVNKAFEIVNRFNELNLIDKDIKINVPGIWQLEAGDEEWACSKVLCEPFIQNYQKFNSNSGWNDDSRAWGEVMQALSHFSYHVSGGQFVLCDLQGGIYQREIVLSDPVILSRNRDYGVTDLSPEGISSFFSQHKCNNYCRPHWT